MFYTYLQLFFIFHFFFIDRYIGVSSSSFFFFSFVFIFKFIKKRTWTELTYLLGLNRDCFTNLSNISSQVGGSPVMLAIVGKIWEKLSYNWMDFFFEELNSTLNFSMMVLEIKCSFLTPLPNPTPPPVWFWSVFLLLPIFFFFKFSPCRTAGLTSFPDYLVLHMRKFVMEEGWVPKKLGIFHVPLFASLQSNFFNIITFVLLEMCNY